MWKMELQRWKIFQNMDPAFTADVKRAYMVGIKSHFGPKKKADTSDGLNNLPYIGAVMVMKKRQVYFVTSSQKDIRVSRGVSDSEGKELLPFVPLKIDDLSGHKIQDVSSGHHHVVVLTNEGRIYQWGHLEFEDAVRTALEPKFLSGDGIEKRKVIQVACGQDHTLALTSDGDVYAWGSNQHGQVGTGRAGSHEMEAVKVSGINEFDAKITFIACGGWTSYALDTEGTVWSWGGKMGNALGYGYESPDPQIIPRKVLLHGSITAIAAGDTHVLTLSNQKLLQFWGQPSHKDRAETPAIMPTIGDVAFVGATRGSSIGAYQTTKGKVYFWGFAYGHYIPMPVPTKFSSIPELFASLDEPIMLEPITLGFKQPVVEKLKAHFDDKETGDIRFKVENQVIFAHSQILKLRSDHFKRMFDNNWKESEQKEVEIKEFTYKSFRAFLLYLYTDRIEPAPQTAQDVIQLFQLADYYGEKHLKGRCEKQLKVLVTEDNVCQVYSASVQYDSKVLHDIAFDFVVPRLNSMVKKEGYKEMPDDLQKRLFQELADEDILVGLKRQRIK